jgi:predicted nucleic acid-binding protein
MLVVNNCNHYNQDMKPLVYIETTIPSYYCDRRPEFAADIARTREWWDQERDGYECFISVIVLEELSTGAYPTQKNCLELVAELALLDVNQEVLDVADVYRSRGLMPQNPVADALHMAIASCYRIDYLLTWNCRHLANVNKTRRLEELNERMGLSTPRLITPHQIYPWEEPT